MRPSQDNYFGYFQECKEDPSKEIKRQLFQHAMRSEWKKVVEIYSNKGASAYSVIITSSGDTALHMAISDGQDWAVRQLVKKIGVGALRLKNLHGNTPLHVAAYLGNARVCGWIAGRDPDLVGVRNNHDETPIFLAAFHGRRDAFLCMHTSIRSKTSDERTGYCGKADGRNILHSAISGEHFELALYIIHLYPRLIRHDEQGVNPLHLLATKPSAFKSGTRMGLIKTMVYHCIYIGRFSHGIYDANNSRTFCGRIRSWFYCKNPSWKNDSENPNDGHHSTDDNLGPSGLDSEDYFYCADFGHCLKTIFKTIFTILTLGLNHPIGRIINLKRKHEWTVQIMQTLVDGISPVEFESDSPSQKTDGDRKHSYDHDIFSKDPDDLVKTTDKGINVGTGEKERDDKKKHFHEEKSFPTVRLTKKKLTEMVENIINTFGISIRESNGKKGDKMLKQNAKKDTPLLIAAKHGIIEMVELILDKYPVAVHGENLDGKNIVLVAVESRQPHVYEFLLHQKMVAHAIFYKTDNDGNSALHLAANLTDRRNWLIPGPALQMQWDVKWYQFVEKSMPTKFFMPYNNNEETPWEIFSESHKDLVNEAKEWLYKTSESCSVVAVLIATVAFTASATVPGGTEKGVPVLAKQPAFNVFAIASLVALCFSIASVVMFMAFFTSRHREKDYGTNLPAKLLVELTSLLVSIAAVLVSFCAAHFFVIKDTFKYTAFSLYAATLFPVALYAFWQIPMYSELVMATLRSTPHRVYEHDN